MNEKQLRFYKAGIDDAHEARKIVFAYSSNRYAALSTEYKMQIGRESVSCVDAYNKGVAFEINRQARLEM